LLREGCVAVGGGVGGRGDLWIHKQELTYIFF
jgi:hypothetical protein